MTKQKYSYVYIALIESSFLKSDVSHKSYCYTGNYFNLYKIAYHAVNNITSTVYNYYCVYEVYLSIEGLSEIYLLQY